MPEIDKPQIDREAWERKIATLSFPDDSKDGDIRKRLLGADNKIIGMILEVEAGTGIGMRYMQFIQLVVDRLHLTYPDASNEFGFVRQYFNKVLARRADESRLAREAVARTLENRQ